MAGNFGRAMGGTVNQRLHSSRRSAKAAASFWLRCDPAVQPPTFSHRQV
jgi:hypothetical protein